MNNREISIINKATKELTKDDIKVLKEHFVRLYKRDVPKRVSPTFLHGNVAWGLQAEAQGEDPIALREKIYKLSKNTILKNPTLSTGAQLYREWKGQTYMVTKTEDGFLYNENSYRSLTAIAKLITGNKISGPRFFGTNKPTNEKAS